MERKGKVIQIHGELVDVREAWRTFIQEGQLAVVTSAALGLLLGIGPEDRQQLIDGKFTVTVRPPEPGSNDWLVSKSRGMGVGLSLWSYYRECFSLAAKGIGSGDIRADDIGETQKDLSVLWGLLSEGTRGSYAEMAPGELAKNLVNIK